MIGFNVPLCLGTETKFVIEAINNHKISGDGVYTKETTEWLRRHLRAEKVLLTTSCTHALEMAAILADIKPGDEVILPSYTFASTADAFVMRGASLVFVDIRPDTMNINEKLIEEAITSKTKAIIPVHYAGIGCEMDEIMDIAKRHNLLVVEDAAQALMATYKGEPLGNFGDFGCFSFHETKNYSMGEGGAIAILNEDMGEKAEIIREKGTDRSKYLRGQIDKYTWVKYGSSYLPSDINAAYLWGQLSESADLVNDYRRKVWYYYHNAFLELEEKGLVDLPVVPEECRHNGHLYYIKAKDLEERNMLIDWLREKDIQAVFHYIPLHSAPAGVKFGRFHGKDTYTTRESERLVRLPLYYGLTEEEQNLVIEAVKEFYRK